MSYLQTIASIAATVFFASTASAYCPADNCSTSASTYLVRTSCGTQANCFQSMSALTGTWTSVSAPNETNCTSCAESWLWGTRNPSESDPVVIDIGPGTFEPFICPKATTGSPNGHVIVRGAGRDETVLKPAAGSGRIGIQVNACEGLFFSDLHAEGPTFGVRWYNGGEATWTSVDMVATMSIAGTGQPENYFVAGWYDSSTISETSTQFLYDCRASVSAATSSGTFVESAYITGAAETYFFGGSLSAGPSSQTISNVYNLFTLNSAEFNAFDTQITVKDAGNSQFGVFAGGSSRVLLQGSSVLVRGGTNRTGLYEEEGAGAKILSIDTPVDAQ